MSGTQSHCPINGDGGGSAVRFKAIVALGMGLALAGAAPATAETLLVSWTESSEGVTASWEQSATPTPLGYQIGQYTDVPISDFKSTGALTIGPYSDVLWFNGGLSLNDVPYGGLFSTPDGYFVLVGPQAYTGPESAPVFQTGTYEGEDYFNNFAAATVTITAVSTGVPEPSTWVMLLMGFAGLAAAFRAGAPGARVELS
jgi:hypothetical protein